MTASYEDEPNRLSDAKTKYVLGDKDTAIKVFKELSDEGVAEATFWLSHWHSTKDEIEEARRLSWAAYEAGYSYGLHFYATLVRDTPQLLRAHAEFMKLGNAGDRSACLALGDQEQSLKNFESAKNWFLKAHGCASKSTESETDVAAPATRLGYLALKMGQIEDAKHWYAIATNLWPQGIHALQSIAKIELDEENFEGAIRWYELLFQANFSLGSFEIADIYDARGDRESSKVWYRRAASSHLAKGLALERLGNIALEEGSIAAATSWWSLGADVGNQDSMLALARAADEEFDFETQIHRLLQAAALGNLQALETLPNLVRTQASSEEIFAFGKILFNLGEIHKAEEFLAAADVGGNPEASHFLGVIKEKQGDRAGAIDYWVKAIEAGNSQSMYELSGVGHLSDDLSIKLLEMSAEKGNHQAQMKLAEMFLERNQTAEALHWLFAAATKGDEKAYALLLLHWEKGSKSAEILENLAWLATKFADLDRGREFWQLAAEHGSSAALVEIVQQNLTDTEEQTLRDKINQSVALGDANGIFAMAKLTEKTGDLVEAKRLFVRAAQQDKTNEEFMFEAYYRTGDIELLKPFALAGSDIAKYQLGLEYLELGLVENALNLFQESSSTNSLPRWQLGRAAFLKGDINMALSWWRNLADYPGENGSAILGWFAEKSGDTPLAEFWFYEAFPTIVFDQKHDFTKMDVDAILELGIGTPEYWREVKNKFTFHHKGSRH